MNPALSLYANEYGYDADALVDIMGEVYAKQHLERVYADKKLDSFVISSKETVNPNKGVVFAPYEPDFIACPFCSEECLEYAEFNCPDCKHQLPAAFWEEFKDNIIEIYGKPAFLMHLSAADLMVCCSDHVMMCSCDANDAISLEVAESTIRGDGLSDSTIWGASCNDCSHANTATCPAYLNWTKNYILFKDGYCAKPAILSRCSDFEEIDPEYPLLEIDDDEWVPNDNEFNSDSDNGELPILKSDLFDSL